MFYLTKNFSSKEMNPSQEVIEAVAKAVIEIEQQLKRQPSGGSKSIRNHSRNRRRHRRIVQQGGDKQAWLNHACTLIFPTDATTGATNFTTLGFYHLIMFVAMLDYLQLSATQFDEDKCAALVGIIKANLRDEHILASYIISMFAEVKTKPGLVAGALTAGYYWTPISSAILSSIHFLLHVASTIVYAEATHFIIGKVLAVYDVLGFRLTLSIGMLVQSVVKNLIMNGPSSIIASIAPPRVEGTSYPVTLAANACTLAQGQVTKTYTFFLNMTERIYNISTALCTTGATAVQYYRSPNTIKTDAVTALIEYVTSKGPITQESLRGLKAQLGEIIGRINQNPLLVQHIPAAPQQLGACSDQNIDDALGSITDLPRPLGPTAAASGRRVSSSIQKASLPPLSRNRHNQRGFQQLWGKNLEPRDSKMGGSSKHKKKHPRSTNKRKLLVKRVRRRRSMKNKNKGKW